MGWDPDCGRKVELSVSVSLDGVPRHSTGVGIGPIDAFTHALADLGVAVTVLDYAEHAPSGGGIDANIVTASLDAFASGGRRAVWAPVSRRCVPVQEAPWPGFRDTVCDPL